MTPLGTIISVLIVPSVFLSVESHMHGYRAAMEEISRPSGMFDGSQISKEFMDKVKQLSNMQPFMENSLNALKITPVNSEVYSAENQPILQTTAHTPDIPPRKYDISPGCQKDISTTQEALTAGDSWAMQLLDAAGKPPSGFLTGNTKWLGAFQQCRDIEVSVSSGNVTTSPFNPLYCTVQVSLDISKLPPINSQAPSSTNVISIGVCVPDSCDEEDAANLINNALRSLPNKTQAFYIPGYSSPCQRENNPLDTPAKGFISLLSLIGALVLLGTLYDVCRQWQDKSNHQVEDKKDTYENIEDKHGVNPDEEAATDANEYKPLLSKKQSKDVNIPSLPGRLLLAFSAYTNGSKILTVDESSKANLSSIHGIRFLSMTWVMLGHTFVFVTRNLANPLQVLEFTKRFTAQAIINATPSVDSFFLMSGILASYLLLPRLVSKGGPRKFPWHIFYIHRYWRLTPPYMLAMAFEVTLFKYLGSGPEYPRETVDYYCHNNWWLNLLYVQNLFRTSEACFGHAWYLANDFQFFLITPLLVVPFYYSKLAGWLVNIVFILATGIAPTVITYVNKFPASSPTSIGYSIRGITYDIQLNFKLIYEAPYSRLGPYAIGILLGYILFVTERRVKIHKGLVALGWALATGLALAVIYGLYGELHGHYLPSWANALYAGFHRDAWAVSLGWLIFACSTGYGGIVNKILSFGGLVPLSRLTYMAYLIHPVIMYYCYGSLQQQVVFTELTMIYFFLGHMVIAYSLAFVSSLALEAPMIGIERILLGK